jgi:hypothetical protein
LKKAVYYICKVEGRHGKKQNKPLTKGNKMKAFLTIDEKSRLELSDLDNENNKPIIFDINADYDGSVKSFATFLSVNGIKSVATSSSIDFSDDYGIDEAMLDGFFNSVKTYEVA